MAITDRSYATIVRSLNVTVNDLAFQCWDLGRYVNIACQRLSSVSVAAGESIKASLTLLWQLHAASKELSDPKETSDSSKQEAMWTMLILDEEHKLRVSKAEIKQRLAAELQANISSYKVKTEAWMQKQIASDLANADAEVADAIARSKEEKTEKNQQDDIFMENKTIQMMKAPLRKYLMSDKKITGDLANSIAPAKLRGTVDMLADRIAADAVVPARAKNAAEIQQDDHAMEIKIESMKAQLRTYLAKYYSRQIAQLQNDETREARKKLSRISQEMHAKREKERQKLTNKELQANKDAELDLVAKNSQDFQEAMAKRQNESDEQVAAKLSGYQHALANGDFHDLVSRFGRKDLLKVALTLDEDKRKDLIKKCIQKEKVRLEKEEKQVMKDFEEKALSQKNKVIHQGKVELMNMTMANMQRIQDRIAQVEQKDSADLKVIEEDGKADIEVKVLEAQDAANKDIAAQVENAEKSLRDTMTKINKGTYDARLGPVRNAIRDKVLELSKKQDNKLDKQLIQQQARETKLMVKHVNTEWEDEAQHRNLHQEKKFGDEFDAKLKEEIVALEEASEQQIKQFQEAQANCSAERRVPAILGSKVAQSVEAARSVCAKLADMKSHCWQFLSSTNNKTLIKKFSTYCKEVSLISATCWSGYSGKSWDVSEELVASMQQVHDVAAAGSLWMEEASGAYDTCQQGGDTKVDAEDKKEVKKDDHRSSIDNDDESRNEKEVVEKDDHSKSSDEQSQEGNEKKKDPDKQKDNTKKVDKSKDDREDSSNESKQKNNDNHSSGEKKDHRRLHDKLHRSTVYSMRDVPLVDKCADLSESLQDAMLHTKSDKQKVFKSATLKNGTRDDAMQQRLTQDGIAVQLKTSQNSAFSEVLKTRHEFKGLMDTVSDRLSSISRSCAGVVSAAKPPCQKLPNQWTRYNKTLRQAEYFADFLQRWVTIKQRSCRDWKADFTDCMTRLHASHERMFDDPAFAQAWHLEDMIQPLIQSTLAALVLTCIIIYSVCKNANRLLSAAVIISYAALLYLVIIDFARGYKMVAIGFCVLFLASACRYHKILAKSKYVSLALQCAASALQGTLGYKVWMAMIPTLLIQGAILVLSLGTALHLRRHYEWPVVPALMSPLLAGVWISEVVARAFCSSVRNAVSLMAVARRQAGTAPFAVKNVFGDKHRLEGIALCALVSALPCCFGAVVSAADSIEVVQPEQGGADLDSDWRLHNAAENEGAVGVAPDISFSEALRIIRLALALAVCTVAIGTPSGSLNAAVIALSVILIGHALAAVPAHALEASLCGFAAVFEQVNTSNLQDERLQLAVRSYIQAKRLREDRLQEAVRSYIQAKRLREDRLQEAVRNYIGGKGSGCKSVRDLRFEALQRNATNADKEDEDAEDDDLTLLIRT
eukprot:gnl/MRDRNA2_/MRDRNA2_34353_c0_seq1.p1 gnl/MRDRNA2_/MRDRNA2_34353_c0~~gnl/MRDRNA2_/MRDRNA2_34353_c0_seq1.p1  ORF type:complete len:1430 (+),score=373.96 gnl/MRDRNA2_/MRDRNA2_34353_c0_seq1:102-4292(+)